MDDGTTKRCPKCGVLKPREAFNLSRSRYDGLQGECRDCRSIRGAKHRAENVERERDRHRQYREENLEDVRAKARAYSRSRYRADPERARKERRDYWNSLAPEERRVILRGQRESRYRSWALWRARQLETQTGPVSRRGIIERDESTCYLCRHLLADRQIELDHVIPLARGGSHTEGNIKVTCRPCNRWKSDRLLSEL